MPDHGRLTEESLPHALPAVAPFYPPPPWKLPGARLAKVIFETATQPVLDWLPPRLTRSSPPYGIITVTHYPESPVGPFSLAAQHIGCRAGFFIRAFALQAVVDSPRALAGLREVWGVPCKLGDVSLDAAKASVSASVSLDGALLVELRLTELEPVEPDSVRLDPVLNVRVMPALEDGKRHESVQVVQIDPDYELTDARRGYPWLRYGDATSEPWSLLPVLNLISGAYCELNTEMPLARFVMPY